MELITYLNREKYVPTSKIKRARNVLSYERPMQQLSDLLTRVAFHIFFSLCILFYACSALMYSVILLVFHWSHDNFGQLMHTHTAVLHLNPDPKATCNTLSPGQRFMCLRT